MNAMPFYKSPVFLLICVAFLTRLIVVMPGISKWTGLTNATVSEYAGYAVLLIGGLADGAALFLRKFSKLNPLTFNQGKSDQVNSGEASPPSMRTPVASFALALPLIVLLSAAIAGCQSTPTAPLPFNQSLGAAYALDTAVLKTLDDLLVVHKITVKDERNVRVQAESFKDALDIAQNSYATNQAAGRSKLDTAMTALQGLQAYLLTLQVGRQP